jgi:hypothetical protein
MGATQDVPTMTTTTTAASTPTAPYATPSTPVAPGETRTRAFLVGAILMCVVVSTVAMVAFIWSGWFKVPEPTTAIIVEGDASFDGTVLFVSGSNLKTPIETRLHASNNYITPILLEPGEYKFTATHNGRDLLRTRVIVRRFLGLRFNLSDYVAQPLTDAAIDAGSAAPGSSPPPPPTPPGPSTPGKQ